MSPNALQNFATRLLEKFNRDDTTTLAASLAFYTALSLAPLLILFVTVSAQLSDELQSTFLDQMHGLVGHDAARAIEMVITGAKNRPDLSSLASAMGVLTLLLSASLIFGQLRATLNKIFATEDPTPKRNSFWWIVWRFVRQRILHVGLALSFIFTLIVSLIASSILSATVHSDQALVMMVVNVFVSMLFYLALFTLLFRYLPDGRLPWARAAQGGALTSLLFVVGKELIGIYLGNSAIGSSYGAAGSVIVLLVWVYYSALITFVGAQVSYVLHQSASSSNSKRT